MNLCSPVVFLLLLLVGTAVAVPTGEVNRKYIQRVADEELNSIIEDEKHIEKKRNDAIHSDTSKDEQLINELSDILEDNIENDDDYDNGEIIDSISDKLNDIDTNTIFDKPENILNLEDNIRNANDARDQLEENGYQIEDGNSYQEDNSDDEDDDDDYQEDYGNEDDEDEEDDYDEDYKHDVYNFDDNDNESNDNYENDYYNYIDEDDDNQNNEYYDDQERENKKDDQNENYYKRLVKDATKLRKKKQQQLDANRMESSIESKSNDLTVKSAGQVLTQSTNRANATSQNEQNSPRWGRGRSRGFRRFRYRGGFRRYRRPRFRMSRRPRFRVLRRFRNNIRPKRPTRQRLISRWRRFRRNNRRRYRIRNRIKRQRSRSSRLRQFRFRRNFIKRLGSRFRRLNLRRGFLRKWKLQKPKRIFGSKGRQLFRSKPISKFGRYMKNIYQKLKKHSRVKKFISAFKSKMKSIKKISKLAINTAKSLLKKYKLKLKSSFGKTGKGKSFDWSNFLAKLIKAAASNGKDNGDGGGDQNHLGGNNGNSNNNGGGDDNNGNNKGGGDDNNGNNKGGGDDNNGKDKTKGSKTKMLSIQSILDTMTVTKRQTNNKTITIDGYTLLALQYVENAFETSVNVDSIQRFVGSDMEIFVGTLPDKRIVTLQTNGKKGSMLIVKSIEKTFNIAIKG